MATNSETLKLSAKELEKNSTSLMQSKLGGTLLNLAGTSLVDCELKSFIEAAHFPHVACQKNMDKRKKVKKGLLPSVFEFTVEEGKEDGITQFFKSADSESSMVLIKTRFSEGYESKKLGEFVSFREYRGVSAIQAAALCGDRDLLIKLLSRVVKEDKYRLDALKQLEEVNLRISNQDILLNAVKAIKEIEFGESDDIKENAKLQLKEIQESEAFQKQMKEFIDEMDELRRETTEKSAKIQRKTTNGGHSGDVKSNAEKKANTENATIKYADDAEALEPVLKLLKAYIYYYLQYPQLSSQGNWDRIDQLWEYVGECHRRLPHYFKQEFFNDKPFSVDPLPTFETSPLRSPCRYWNKVLLDLDGLGIGSVAGIYKGLGGLVAGACGAARVGVARLRSVVDLTVVAHLYELRKTGLENIIKQLRDPETAKTLVSIVDGVKPKP